MIQELAAHNLAVWDQAAALSRLNGKDARQRRLVSLFLDDVPFRMVDLRKTIADDQFNDAKSIAHEIKDFAVMHHAV
jgi:HPt (histidine-containing phosphotransfer) domain-containing protein